MYVIHTYVYMFICLKLLGSVGRLVCYSVCHNFFKKGREVLLATLLSEHLLFSFIPKFYVYIWVNSLLKNFKYLLSAILIRYV